MDKKGKINEFVDRFDKIKNTVKRSYLYKLVSKFLSVACTIILILLLIVGGLMFIFNMKVKSYEKKGLEYMSPFGLYTIISGSMEPNVSVYDVVISVNTDISKIKVGDIITFISTWEINSGKTITHRVVDITKNENGEYQLSTKGDNNQSKDGSVVTQNYLIGKVVGRIPQLGRLQYFLATKMGWFLVVFIPALGIIIYDIIKIFKLYVLKDKIDKVKTRKEALRDALQKKPTLANDNTIRPTIDSIILEEESSSSLNSEKENNLELPAVKNEKEVNLDDKFSSVEVDIEIPKKADEGVQSTFGVELPTINSAITKETDLELPAIKETADIPVAVKTNKTEDIKHVPINRNKLKRRNN